MGVRYLKPTVQLETNIPSCYPELLSKRKGIHVFFDDIQGVFRWDEVKKDINKNYDIFKVLLELSCSCHVWISCDTLQSPLYIADEEERLRHDSRLAKLFNDELSSTQLVSLSKNLRNTSDLSRALSVIREHIIESENLVSTFTNDFDILQTPGHYIHGPKTVVHVLQKYNEELIYSIFDKEFKELCFDGMIDGNDVGILYNLWDNNTDNLSKTIVDGILSSKNITPRKVTSTYSKEWPAVVALQQLFDYKAEILTGVSVQNVSFDSELLYLAISRARVKCTVIMFPVKGAILEDYHRMCSLLDKLKDSVEVRYH
ncbi:uncharacterized protein LOC134825235 [Bolinopsis microptera]|uniref:uncharacterized protein LOC134825235 n=1 Tax=Bolinopsis microptera TaxID=2820187 RepID=UPI003079AB8C